jgi:hypothetical protein
MPLDGGGERRVRRGDYKDDVGLITIGNEEILYCKT